MLNSYKRLSIFCVVALGACAEAPPELPIRSNANFSVQGFEERQGMNFVGDLETAERQLDRYCGASDTPCRLDFENANGVEVQLRFLLPGEDWRSNLPGLQASGITEPLIVAWKREGLATSFRLSDAQGTIIASQYGYNLDGLTSEMSVAVGPPAALPTVGICGIVQATSLLLGPSDSTVELAIGESAELDNLTVAHNNYSGTVDAYGPCGPGREGFLSWITIYRPSAFGDDPD